MNFYNKIFSLFFILIVISADFTSAQDCISHIKLNSDIPNTIFYIDTVKIGEGNQLTAEVKNGMHKITALENSDRWNAKTFVDTINLKCNEDTTLNFIFRSSSYIQTNPADAYVYYNDSLIGHTPMFINEKIKHIKLVKEGYENINYHLSDSPAPGVIDLKFIGMKEGKSFFKKDLFKILVGSLLVLGGTTAYFKIKADNNFSKYQDTADNSYLTKTRRYDLISGITFGAVQINFGLIIYYFLFD